MARDHRRLRVFHDAHALALAVYKHTRGFPRDEWFGVRSQIRRAAVSVPSNVVEGSARRSSREYVRFLTIARASAAELSYLVSLCTELGYLSTAAHAELEPQCDRLNAQLQALLNSLDDLSDGA